MRSMASAAFAAIAWAMIAWPTPMARGLADDGLAEAPTDAWPMARGCVEGTGRSAATIRLPAGELWQRRFDGTAFEASPIVAAGTIYVGDLDGTFHALSLETGETRWSFKAEAGFAAAAAFVASKSLVVAGDQAGVVRAFDAARGALVWQYACEGEISGGPSVVPGDGAPRVLVGSQDASLSSLDAATGEAAWKHAIADQIRCTPTVVAGRVLIAGCDGRLHTIDVSSGKPAGEVAIDGPTGTTPAAAGTVVFFGSEGGTFYCIDVGRTADAAPAIVWQKKAAGGSQGYRSSAAIAEGPSGRLAIVGTRGRAVEAFATADGSRAWRAAMRGRVDASPVIVDATTESREPTESVAIVADSAGKIAAIRVGDGSIRWEFDAGAGFAASPAVAAGRIVTADEEGTVRCFGRTE